MALHGLLRRGIESALAAAGARAELESIANAAGHPAGSGEHLEQTIVAMPGLLVAIDRERRGEAAPAGLTELWPSVITYLLLDDDLVPSRAGAPVGGVLDDALLVHLTAQKLRDRLREVDLRSVDGGAALLVSVLPPPVVATLRETVERALERAGRSE